MKPIWIDNVFFLLGIFVGVVGVIAAVAHREIRDALDDLFGHKD